EEPPIGTRYDHDPPCKYMRDGGGMQPTQGVFQDDLTFDKVTWTGSPQENVQLIENSPGSYYARLPMVEGRDTVLIGVYAFDRKGHNIVGGNRKVIEIKLKTNCSKMIPVKARFEVEDSSGRREIYTTRLLTNVPLAGNPLK